MNERDKKRLKEIMDRALVGTRMNYPTFDLASTISYEIIKKIDAYTNFKWFENQYACISEVSEKYKVPLRSEIKAFCDVHKLDFYSQLLRMSAENWSKKGLDIKGGEISKMTLIYADFIENYLKKSFREREDYVENYKEYLNNKDMIYDVVNLITNDYIASIDFEKAFEPVLKIETQEALYEFLTNVSGFKLMDSYSGKLLEGKIQLTADRGFKEDKTKPQQDAALSIVREDNLFLNIIADGAGGSEIGEAASKEIIIQMKKWFENTDRELFEDIDLVVELLKEKLNEINIEVNKKYENSYSTVVLSLTIKDKTIIVSVGDSTAYTYDGEELVLLTELDSFVNGYYYEDARWNAGNNIITSAIGDRYPVEPHVNIIENKGQRIILSSDGVTDLVSDETFISYFVNKSSSDKIVDDALNNPEVMYEFEDEEGVMEVHYLPKTEDNISAIVVDLPNEKVKKL